jgi:hypothetical protein
MPINTIMSLLIIIIQRLLNEMSMNIFEHSIDN